MSKVKEATNDFCTRCFKYSKCSKVQFECTMADSYQEGYEDGYHQAEKDLELTWEDIRRIYLLVNFTINDVSMDNLTDKSIYQEVLRRFNEQRNDTSYRL